MKRLTPARIQRWKDDEYKAFQLLDKIERETAEYRLASKGGRLSNLTRVMMTARMAKQHVGTLGGELKTLHEAETR
jgi:hypothetical protein